MVMKMYEELDKLIEFIEKEYKYINEKWQNSLYYDKINMKNNLVRDVLNDQRILNLY